MTNGRETEAILAPAAETKKVVGRKVGKEQRLFLSG